MRALALALALLTALGSAGAEPRPRPKRRLELAGGLVFGVAWTPALVFAARFEEPEASVPLLGPLIALRRCGGCTADPIESGIVAGLVVDFALQATGVALFTVGLVRHARAARAASDRPSP